MNEKMIFESINVLLVEDSIADVRLTTEVLKDGKIKMNLNAVYDGIEALEYLKNRGKYRDSIRPDLILLDLNLPKKDGREVLKEIKGDRDLKRIPIVILTVSKDELDIIKTYDLGANCFITKPVNLEQFIVVVKSIEDFWFTVVKLPPNGKIHK
ncbi:MAG: response regulator [Actinobacteria bacterium]|nr:response regulator [Actinomycetota bacterium]